MPRSPLRALVVPFLFLAACDHSPTQPGETTAPEFAAIAFTIQSDFPFDVTTFVPCGNGGAGQDVTFSGTIHDVFHFTQSPSGHVTAKVLDNPQGVTGVGLANGAIYHATGQTQQIITTRIGQTVTFINRFHLVSSGPGTTFVVYETFHLTVNANGTLTTFKDNLRIDCQ